MGKIALRSTHNGESIDKLNDENLISLGVSADESAVGASNNVSMYFRKGNIIMSNDDETSLEFNEMFTVCFWAKLPVKAITDTVYPNKIVLVMNDGTVAIDYTMPDTLLDDEWHYYAIQRDGSNTIKLYVDGTEETSVSVVDTNSFNLTDNSYLYMGNDNYNATGYDVVVDDFIVINTVIYNGNFTNPTEYVDLNSFKRCLYIKVSTGEVFGYKED